MRSFHSAISFDWPLPRVSPSRDRNHSAWFWQLEGALWSCAWLQGLIQPTRKLFQLRIPAGRLVVWAQELQQRLAFLRVFGNDFEGYERRGRQDNPGNSPIQPTKPKP